jgi:hypothetical protein
MIKMSAKIEALHRDAILLRLDEAMKRAKESSCNLECVAIDLAVSVCEHRAVHQECAELALTALKETHA